MTHLLRFLRVLLVAALLLAVVAFVAITIDERLSRQVSADETAGMATQQNLSRR